jgi:hypothetical protein
MDYSNFKDMNLCDLALACSMYDSLTPFNASLSRLKKSSTTDGINLSKAAHRICLLKWLNDWGCRHLSKKSHDIASLAILDWHSQEGMNLFQKGTSLWELDNQEIENVVAAYASLRNRIGAYTTRGGKGLQISIGPTAASKILFAVRPEALMPWDEAMRKKFDCDGSPESYFKFLVEIRKFILHTKDLCKTRGFDISELPHKINRDGSTVLELVNEYIWVTITRECNLPSPENLAIWAQWGLSIEKKA